MKRIIFILFLMIGIVYADTLPHTDNFDSSTDGYTGSGIYQNNDIWGNGWLIIPTQKTATKTYDFGSANANKTVKVIFRFYLSFDWDSFNAWRISKDYFKITVNNQTFSYVEFGGFTYIKTLYVRLDSEGKMRIEFYTDSDQSNEWAKLDYVKIEEDINYNVDKPREFTMQKQDNIRGNIVMIGNSVLQKNGGSCASSTTQNNDIDAVYANEDNDSNTYNSTWAQLKLPKEVNSSDIVYALLYWQGRTGSNLEAATYGRTVKIKFYGSTDYETVTSEDDKFNYINGDYQGVKDVTNLLKESMDNVGNEELNTTGYNKLVWVADVYTDTGYNEYGAWALIVTYKDHNDKLRNITLYDGYDQIYYNQKSYTLSGFLTPMHGTVDAKFLVFAGEGDVVYPDEINLTNKSGVSHSLGEDFFHSSENVDGENILDRGPNCANTIGIDLQTVSVGTNAPIASHRIIGNGQTSTTVTLWSGRDEYFPGVFAFSTQLYEPRVCYYIDTIKDEDGEPIYEDKKFVGQIDPSKEYNITVWISNIKKQGDTSDDHEDAYKVRVKMKMYDFNYTGESTLIKNTDWDQYFHQTDANDTGEHELFNYLSDENVSYFNVGDDATSNEGGFIKYYTDFASAKKAYINFRGKFNISNNTGNNDDNLTLDINDTFKFFASYQIQGGYDFGGKYMPIDPCEKLNTTANIAGLLGSFNVVNVNGGNGDFNNPDSYQNKLYTQIVNRPFTVKIIHLNHTLDGLENYTGEVNVTLIANPYHEGDTDEEKQNECDNAPALTLWTTVSFDNNNSNTFIFSYGKAIKDARFKIQYRDGNSSKYACSLDDFAIRPAKYRVLDPNQKLIAGQDVNVTVQAIDYNGTLINDFNFTNAPVELNITDARGCITRHVTKPSPLQTNVNFVNGVANLTFNYPDVGDLNISVKEDNTSNNVFAAVDINDTVDASGTKENQSVLLIGEGNSTIRRFYPDHFAVSGTYNNPANGTFTYISSDLNMSAELNLTITAENEDNGTTYNYNNNCYAKNFDLNISYDDLNASKVPTILYEINSTEYNTATNNDLNFTNLSKDFFDTDNNGTANITVKINFDKNYTNPVEEFNMTVRDVNVSDVNGTFGTHDINDSARFIYGRIKVSNAAAYSSDINTTFEYQYWTDEGWVVNKDHNDSNESNVTITLPLYAPNPSDVTMNIIQQSSKYILEGKEKIKISTTHSLPYSAKIHLKINSWLWYHPLAKDYQDPSSTNTDCLTHPCMKLDFLNSGTAWGGVGAINNTAYTEENRTSEINVTHTDVNVSKSQVKKINW